MKVLFTHSYFLQFDEKQRVQRKPYPPLATIQVASNGGLELVNQSLTGNLTGGNQHGILLRQNQGLKCVQVTNSAAGNTGWEITITVE